MIKVHEINNTISVSYKLDNLENLKLLLKILQNNFWIVCIKKATKIEIFPSKNYLNGALDVGVCPKNVH